MKRWVMLFLSMTCLTACGTMQKDIKVQDTRCEIDGKVCQKVTALPDQKEAKKQTVEDYVQTMSLEEKVGQLFMIALREDAAGNPITVLGEEEKKCIREHHVAGVILFSENIVDGLQVKKLIADFQSSLKIPLFIGVDEEGGIVSRVGKNRAINNEPRNTVIGERSFGTNSQTVTPMVLAFSKGLKEEGILPVIKHFPGHGNTIEDSHNGMAYVKKDLIGLEKEELVPFMTAMDQGIDGVMKGHLLVSDVDAVYPASLSKAWDKYLKEHEELSKTLFITDALNMGAIVDHYSSSEAAILAIEAGNDILLMPQNLEKAYQGVLWAVKTGRLSEKQIDTAVIKILSKKIAQNLFMLS